MMRRFLTLTMLLLFFPLVAQAATVIDTDFNNQSWGALSPGSYWTLQPSGGVNNSPAARLEYSVVGTAGKALALNVAAYQSNQFTIEFDIKMDGSPSGDTKFVKLFGSSQASQNNMTFGNNGTQKETAYYMDTLCVSKWDGTDRGSCTPPTHLVSSGPIDMTGGTWGHYKLFVRRATPGQADGEVKVWWNGTLRSHITNMDSNPSGSSTPYFYQIEFGGYLHSNFNGTPWYWWMDNLKVTTDDSSGTVTPAPTPTPTPTPIPTPTPTPDPTPVPSGVFSWAQQSYSVDEGVGTATFTINRSDATTAASVDWGTFQNTATVGQDYQGVTWQTLNFAAGESSKDVSVQIIDDSFAENDETFTLALANPVNASLASAPNATVTIKDNDAIVAPTPPPVTTPGVFGWSAPGYTVDEGTGLATFTILRTDGASGDASVDFRTLPNTATENLDYTGTGWQTVTFVDGETSKLVTVPIIDDSLVEGDETFTISLANPVNGTLGTATDATVTIHDNDTAQPVAKPSPPRNLRWVVRHAQ